MPRTHHIVELSATAGADSEGFAFGAVGRSLFTAAFSDAKISGIVYAYVRDRSSGSTAYSDVGTRLDGSTTGPTPVTPWNSTGDALVLACDTPVSEIFVRVSTAGVGSWTGLEVYDSTDGVRFNRLRTVSSDTTNALKALGIGRIVLAADATASVNHSPAPDDITSRRWYAIVPIGMSAAPTTLPAIDRVWLKHDSDTSHSSFAALLNVDPTVAVFTGVPDTFFAHEGQVAYYVLPGPAFGVDWTIHRRGDVSATIVYEYLATDDTWKLLPNFTDTSSNFTVGPATLGASAAQLLRWRWTIPSDWTSKTLTPVNVQNPPTSGTGFVIRSRVTAIAGARVATTPFYRGRVRAFGQGNVSGVTEPVAVKFARLQFSRIGSQTAALVAEVVNMTSGSGATVSIPANYGIGSMLTLSTPLTLAAGEQFDVRWVSGGRIDDADIHMSEV